MLQRMVGGGAGQSLLVFPLAPVALSDFLASRLSRMGLLAV